jgi:hypothetical protein
MSECNIAVESKQYTGSFHSSKPNVGQGMESDGTGAAMKYAGPTDGQLNSASLVPRGSICRNTQRGR